MKQPKDARPIRAGDHTLTGFAIHRNGSVYSGIRPLQAMCIKNAAKYWNHMSGQIWHDLLDDAADRRRPQRRKIKLADLVYIDRDHVFFNTATGDFERDQTPVVTTRWYFQRRTPATNDPKAYLLPEDLPLAGAPGIGWYGIQIAEDFTTLLHGPSLAAFVFSTRN